MTAVTDLIYNVAGGNESSGHNGLKSVMGCIPLTSLHRIKIGIGRPAQRAEIPNHVLAKFKVSERISLEEDIFPDTLTRLKDIFRERLLTTSSSSPSPR